MLPHSPSDDNVFSNIRMPSIHHLVEHLLRIGVVEVAVLTEGQVYC